jgi:hypothetical protein
MNGIYFPLHFDRSKLFKIVATCDGLEELSLIFHSSMVSVLLCHFHKNALEEIPGSKAALITAESLQTLRVKTCDKTNFCLSSLDQPPQPVQISRRAEKVAALALLEANLRFRTKEFRGTTK